MAAPQEGPTSGQRLREVLPDLAAGAAASAVDAAATGSLSAGVLAPLGAAVIRISGDAIRRRRQRAERVLQGAVDSMSGQKGLEEVEEWATADPAHLELTVRVIEAAIRTTQEDKIHALGRVLAAGVQGHATVDESLLLTTALDQLEAPHLQILAALRAHVNNHVDVDDPRQHLAATTLTVEQLRETLPGHAPVLLALLPVLSGHGLVESITGGLTDVVRASSGMWGLTDYGNYCLEYLEHSTQDAG